jgi:hypothetical protein
VRARRSTRCGSPPRMAAAACRRASSGFHASRRSGRVASRSISPAAPPKSRASRALSAPPPRARTRQLRRSATRRNAAPETVMVISSRAES